MKTIILAGGRGTRLLEETSSLPKPMVTVGGRPILWHIMMIYSQYGFNDFVVCLGHRGEVIKEWLLSLSRTSGSFEVDLGTGVVSSHTDQLQPPWKVLALETGEDTQTGGRLKRALASVNDSEIMLTYGDGVADVNIPELLAFHRAHGGIATVTAVRPPARFGSLQLQGAQVTHFGEKSTASEGWINGGFLVLNRQVTEFIDDDMTPLEQAPLSRLAGEGELYAYRHEGFWHPMDTLRERIELENLWASGYAPWRTW